MCGEQHLRGFFSTYMIGSPPRVRGTEAARDAPEDKPGITPACAGNSCAPASPGPSAPDHPRVCGEQTMLCLMKSKRSGSPPRVRGTADLFPHACTGFRITPACAGNSNSFCHFPLNGKDHPRVCGEQCISLCLPIAPWGSPPRVRGTVFDVNAEELQVRITPACAGNSFPFTYFPYTSKDHPRVCGEQSISPQLSHRT